MPDSTQMQTRNELRAAVYAALARLGEEETRKVVTECMSNGVSGSNGYGDRWEDRR